MVEAYILIQAEPGTGPEVTMEVSEMKGVGSRKIVTRLRIGGRASPGPRLQRDGEGYKSLGC
jgi:hypothetical protein